ncbi:energy transducer TonB [Nitrosomonas sp. JL21]|uniref:energy transducer TonB n=1 Tax=Nitrosomonas sp. JL21 TaxID=153949 RepID=UPI00136E7835|nr:energy transducer TonB [Nitrosomonas sp. JL21]MBL8496256.1 energy transducer TonB [Nitrosomonas sp.]MXS76977.1 energy transducer TonB [Nitrosomonas sp. JL21]
MGTTTFKHHLAGIASMLFGLIVVFGLIFWMNHAVEEADKKSVQEMTDIAMMPEIKPEPKQEIKKTETKRAPRPQQTAAPFKGFATSLSGIDMGSLGLNDGQGDTLKDDLLGKTDQAVMTADLVDVPPKPITRGSFKYPPAAKKNGVNGYVVLSVLVEADGSVNQVQVLESSPSGIFDAAALQGIRAWHFEPAKYKGDAVRVWAKQRIRFDLS